MKRFLRNNGLSLVTFGLFFVTFLVGQIVSGRLAYNADQEDHGEQPLSLVEYLKTPHFVEATTENWESEFLQMYLFVVLTTFLYQKGSAESKDPDREEEVDRDPRRSKRKDAPWPVHRGGFVLKLYEHSLSLAFLLLFVISFLLHAAGGARHYSEEQLQHGGDGVGMMQYMTTSQFWFESLQNWQSEFLAVGSIVLLSVWLRERGSPESKPVDEPHHSTGK